MKYSALSKNILKSHFFKSRHMSLYIPFVYKLIKNKDDTILGWGRKKSGKKAVEIATKENVDYMLLEDGFIRSINTTTHDKSFSIVEDPIGIFYDATHPSLLENIIKNQELEPFQQQEVVDFMKDLERYNISKYNSGKRINLDYLHQHYNIDPKKPIVLIPTQVERDLSLKYGLTDFFTIDEIIHIAKDENPTATVIVKKHPRSKIIKEIEGVVYIDEDINIISLLKLVEKVYVQSSQVGFEALILNKKVVTFGVPFYAGWGVTDDRCRNIENHQIQKAFNRRSENKTIEEIVYSMYFEYTKYKDPYTKENIFAHEALRRLNCYRRHYERIHKDLVFYKISRWKKKYIKQFFNEARSIRFVDDVSQVKQNEILCLWGLKYEKDVSNIDNEIYIIEDGFIRSKKLGAHKTPALSLCIDKKGIYFDPTTDSDIECILNSATNFNSYTDYQAQKVIQKLCQMKVSKYNNSASIFQIDPDSYNKNKILVIGQVEDDMSIIKAGNGYTNEKLLREVKTSNPDAWIVYREHPDVTAKKRKGIIDRKILNSLIDQFDKNTNLHTVFNVIDEVHTISSLTGLEALIYNKDVYCYGMPFYAGWGLTVDKYINEKRNRLLSLEDLVYATYIEYPVYFNYHEKRFSSFFEAIDEIGIKK